MMISTAAVAVIAGSLVPSEASVRQRAKVMRYFDVVENRGLAPADFCGGRLPAYGVDACGYREVSHGPGSCWRRLPYRPYAPEPRRVWICGRTVAVF
jgi:hypothetical protein